jgi:ArsR family transcriptional regulator
MGQGVVLLGGGGVCTVTETSVIVKRRPRKKKEDPKAPSLPLKVTNGLLADLSDLFKLLADKSRLKIVLVLAQEGQMNVNALCKLLKQSQPAVSHHLTLMRMVGLVDYDRKGKFNNYYLASDHLRNLFEQFFLHTENGRQALEFDDFALVFAPR